MRHGWIGLLIFLTGLIGLIEIYSNLSLLKGLPYVFESSVGLGIMSLLGFVMMYYGHKNRMRKL